MKIRKGDTVQIMIGKDRGRHGKILSAHPERETVIVEGLNLYKKHVRPKSQGAKGETVETARPVPVSRVRLVCHSCGKPARTGYRIEEGKRFRYCKKCKSVI